jgi:hypothetical protein
MNLRIHLGDRSEGAPRYDVGEDVGKDDGEYGFANG